MKCVLSAVFLGLLTVVQAEWEPQRIVGGSAVSIGRYPYMAALLRSAANTHRLRCAGSIINARTIVTAAHCFSGEAASRWRMRLGSTNAHSGGRVLSVSNIRIHPSYRAATKDSDIALLRSASAISFGGNIRAVRIAGTNYNLGSGQAVSAAGWGATSHGGNTVEGLRHVSLTTVLRTTCRNNYAGRGMTVTNNMVCAGRINGGGRDQCQGDSGGPLIHNGVLVGICSWGYRCGLARYPGVNTLVPRFTTWINNNSWR